ncbi:hypothetical protein [Micromonospora sp. NPDC051006]|uniref:hypothetical protein n=1 Tax=Micromonospora sp. NPDC051006 TaxID=3364283 RepID=UPI003794A60B
MTTEAIVTDLDLDAIEMRAAGATPGPWATDPDSAWRRCHEAHEYVYATDPTDRAGIVALTGIKGEHVRNARDAAFIAHARTDVPALVAEVRRLRAELAEVNGRCDQTAAARDRYKRERDTERAVADQLRQDLREADDNYGALQQHIADIRNGDA